MTVCNGTIYLIQNGDLVIARIGPTGVVFVFSIAVIHNLTILSMKYVGLQLQV